MTFLIKITKNEYFGGMGRLCFCWTGARRNLAGRKRLELGKKVGAQSSKGYRQKGFCFSLGGSAIPPYALINGDWYCILRTRSVTSVFSFFERILLATLTYLEKYFDNHFCQIMNISCWFDSNGVKYSFNLQRTGIFFLHRVFSFRVVFAPFS